jgi:hypothetical protein
MEQTINLSLVMSFLDADGNQINFSLDNPVETLEESTVRDTMAVIIEKNIFAPRGFKLVSADAAKIIETKTSRYF